MGPATRGPERRIESPRITGAGTASALVHRGPERRALRRVGVTSRSVSRILSPVRTGRRPSIWMHRCRAPRAANPQARASSPRAPAQPHSEECGLRPCSGRGLPSRPGHPGRWCALTAPFHPYRQTSEEDAGGLFSVALSRGSPRVAVNNRPALWSPDFPRRRAAAHRCPFPSTRSPDRLVGHHCAVSSATDTPGPPECPAERRPRPQRPASRESECQCAHSESTVEHPLDAPSAAARTAAGMARYHR